MINYNPHRWIDNFFQLRGSIIREIFPRVLLCSAWSVFVVWYHLHVRAISIPSSVHALIGLALGMLLVFRTNASYDRFWEGRKLWGMLSGNMRNLIISSESFLYNAPDLRRKIALWGLAFIYGLMNFLRSKKDFGPVTRLLDPVKVREGLNSPHPAAYAAKQLSLIFQAARTANLIGEHKQVSMQELVQKFIEILGACERIRRTPLPFAYVIHLRRALVIYCYTIPFALLEAFHWIWTTVFATVFLSYILFGIEEIGVEIEDPFGQDENDLPLETICETIQKNTEGLLTVTLEPESKWKVI